MPKILRKKSRLKKRTIKRKKNPNSFSFQPGFYYRTSTASSDFPIGPSIIYISLDGSIYSIDLHSLRFFKNLDGKVDIERKEKYQREANDPNWMLFIEPIKNEKLLMFLHKLRENIRL